MVKFLVALNNITLEKFISDLEQTDVIENVRSRDMLVEKIRLSKPETIIISHLLPGTEKMENIISEIVNLPEQKVRIIYLYGPNDSRRRAYTNFLIRNGIYDFHYGDLDAESLRELLFHPKKEADVKIEQVEEEIKVEINLTEEKKKINESEDEKTEIVLKEEECEIKPEEKTEDKLEENLEVKVQEITPEQKLEVRFIERIVEVEKEVIKPVFIEKNRFSVKQQIVGTVIISVAGLQQGSGTTYNSIQLAKVLSQKQFRVGLVELKKKNEYGLIHLPKTLKYNDFSFKCETFDVYAGGGQADSNELIIAATSQDYDYIILDCGTLFDYDMENAEYDKPETVIKKYKKGIFYNDFMKADFKILTSFSDLYFSDSIEYFSNYINLWNIHNLELFLTYTEEELLKKYKKTIVCNVHAVPYNASFQVTEEQITFYSKVLDRILPKNIEKSKWSFGKAIKSLFQS